MVVITQHDEQSLEPSTEAVSDNLIDPGKVIVVKAGRQSCDGLNEVVGTEAAGRRAGWSSGEGRPGTITLDAVVPAGIRVPVHGPQLVQNGDPHLGLEGDLVPEAHSLEGSRQLNGAVVTKKPGKEVPDLLGRVVRVHLDVVRCGASGALPERVGDEEHLKIKAGTIGMKNQPNVVGNLLLDSCGPLLVRHTGQPGQSLEDKPVLLVPVLDPIIELSVHGNLNRNLLMQTVMAVF